MDEIIEEYVKPILVGVAMTWGMIGALFILAFILSFVPIGQEAVTRTLQYMIAWLTGWDSGAVISKIAVTAIGAAMYLYYQNEE